MKIEIKDIDKHIEFFKDELKGCFDQLNSTMFRDTETVLTDSLLITETIGRIHNAIDVLEGIKFSTNRGKVKKHKSKGNKKVQSKTENNPNILPTRQFSSEEEKALMVGYADELHG